MKAPNVKRPKDLEDENRQLKQMYAEFSLDHKILKVEFLQLKQRAI